MAMDKKTLARLKKKIPDLTADTTEEELINKLGGYDTIVAVKDAQGVWRFQAHGSGVNTPESRKVAIAELVAYILNPE